MWKDKVGKSFTRDEFIEYVKALKLADWRPLFIVLHNTSEPTIAQWHSTPGQQRMDNLEDYYRNQLGWSAGPHLFIADDLIWVFTPLTTSGVHSPSWNNISLGVEMVGEYETEDFNSGLGGNVHINAVSALATLSMKFELDSHSLKFHKEDPATTHKECPGRQVIKAAVMKEVHDEIVRRQNAT